MDPGLIGFLIWIIVALVSGIAWNVAWPRQILPSICAATTSAVLLQLMDYWLLGYLDPFAPIGFVTSFAIAFAIAVVIELRFRKHRARRGAIDA